MPPELLFNRSEGIGACHGLLSRRPHHSVRHRSIQLNTDAQFSLGNNQYETRARIVVHSRRTPKLSSRGLVTAAKPANRQPQGG